MTITTLPEHLKPMKEQVEAADTIARLEREKSEAVLSFAKAVLHGDEVHKAWLLEAAQAWTDGKPLPPPRSEPAEKAEAFKAGMERAAEIALSQYENRGRNIAVAILAEAEKEVKPRFTAMGLCPQGWSFSEVDGVRSYHCKCSECGTLFMAPDRMTICQPCAMIQAGERP